MNRTLSWLATAVAGGYMLWCCFSLSRRIPVFANMFASLGAELPLPTRMALAMGRPAVLWIVAAVVVVLLVAKELAMQSVSARIAVSVVVFMVTALVMSLISEALMLPMLELMRQIG